MTTSAEIKQALERRAEEGSWGYYEDKMGYIAGHADLHDIVVEMAEALDEVQFLIPAIKTALTRTSEFEWNVLEKDVERWHSIIRMKNVMENLEAFLKEKE